MNRCFLTNYGVNEEAINIRNVLCTLQILIQHQRTHLVVSGVNYPLIHPKSLKPKVTPRSHVGLIIAKKSSDSSNRTIGNPNEELLYNKELFSEEKLKKCIKCDLYKNYIHTISMYEIYWYWKLWLNSLTRGQLIDKIRLGALHWGLEWKIWINSYFFRVKSMDMCKRILSNFYQKCNNELSNCQQSKSKLLFPVCNYWHFGHSRSENWARVIVSGKWYFEQDIYRKTK